MSELLEDAGLYTLTLMDLVTTINATIICGLYSGSVGKSLRLGMVLLLTQHIITYFMYYINPDHIVPIFYLSSEPQVIIIQLSYLLPILFSTLGVKLIARLYEWDNIHTKVAYKTIGAGVLGLFIQGISSHFIESYEIASYGILKMLYMWVFLLLLITMIIMKGLYNENEIAYRFCLRYEKLVYKFAFGWCFVGFILFTTLN